MENNKKSPQELVKSVKSDLAKYRKQFESNWKDEEDAYYGIIWKNDRGSRKPYENFTFPIVESELAILTDGYPSGVVSVKNPLKKSSGENLNKAIELQFKEQDFSSKLELSTREALIAAPGFLHFYHDANASNGEGKNIIENLNWRQVWLSGDSYFIDECSKARIELKRSRDWLKLNYQKYSDEIEKSEALCKDDVIEKNDGLETRDVGASSGRIKPAPYFDSDLLKLVKTYVRDYSMISISEEETIEELEKEMEALAENNAPDVEKGQDHQKHIENHKQDLSKLFNEFGIALNDDLDDSYSVLEQVVEQMLNQNPESGLESVLLKARILINHIESHKILLEENPNGQKLKYKKALRVIETLGDVVLYDGPSKDDHCMIPIVPIYCYKISSIYGFGEIRNILDSQRMAAVMQYKQYKGLHKVANPIIVVDKATGLTKNDVTNEDGAVYILEKGDINYKNPGSTSPQIDSFIQDRKKAISDISGMNDASQGKLMHPNQSGFSIDKLQQQASGRVRLKDRNLQRHSIKRATYLMAALTIQYFTTDKVLEINQGENGIEEVIYNPLGMQDLDFEIEINEGSLAGVDVDALNSLYASFVRDGHLTFDEFLTISPRLPGKNKIIEMIKKRNDQSAALEQMKQENIMLKGQFSPDSLTPDELKIFQQMQQQNAVNNDQA